MRFVRHACGIICAVMMPCIPQSAAAQTAFPAQARDASTAPDLQSIIADAAHRFGLPERWITEVIRAESNGNPRATSPMGAMGLMQIMPATWDGLRARYGLGDNAYNVRDNVFAGAAYLRTLYDQFGSPDCFAAYNAGPGRVVAYRSGARRLPVETVSYVALITSRLGGNAVPLRSHSAAGFVAAAPNWIAAPLFAHKADAAPVPSERQPLADMTRQTAAIALPLTPALSAPVTPPINRLFVPRNTSGAAQ